MAMSPDTSLTDDDVRAMLGENAMPIKYSELKTRTLDELLPPTGYHFQILLLECAPSKGHWVCLCRNNGTIEYFNSYGKAYDKDLNVVPACVRAILGETPNTIHNFLDGHECKSMMTKLQGPKSQTCGRYCVLRCAMGKLGYDNKEFVEWLDKQRNGKTFDETIRTIVKN
jgi:hypothetical protein